MNAADFPRVGLPQAIETLAGMPGFVLAALDAAARDELALHPAQDAFSLAEQACHLRDLEREGYLVRVRRMLAEDVPQLEGFDGAAMAKARDYSSQDGRAAARDFAAARGELIALLAALDETRLARQGLFDGRRITLADLVAMVVDHDRGHREEIEELGRMIEARRWK